MRRDYRKIAIQNYTVRIRLKLGIQISGKAEKFYRHELKIFFPLPGEWRCAYKALREYPASREIHEFSCSET